MITCQSCLREADEWERIPDRLRLALDLMPYITALEQLHMHQTAHALVEAVRVLKQVPLPDWLEVGKQEDWAE